MSVLEAHAHGHALTLRRAIQILTGYHGFRRFQANICGNANPGGSRKGLSSSRDGGAPRIDFNTLLDETLKGSGRGIPS